VAIEDVSLRAEQEQCVKKSIFCFCMKQFQVCIPQEMRSIIADKDC
jgi:hypothetical protein